MPTCFPTKADRVSRAEGTSPPQEWRLFVCCKNLLRIIAFTIEKQASHKMIGHETRADSLALRQRQREHIARVGVICNTLAERVCPIITPLVRWDQQVWPRLVVRHIIFTLGYRLKDGRVIFATPAQLPRQYICG